MSIPAEIDKYIRLFAWPVFPVHTARIDGDAILCTCGKAYPKDAKEFDNGCKPGKHPRTTHGFQDATTDYDMVERWCNKWSNTNWGMTTGKRKFDNILVVDIDPRHGGNETVDRLRDEGKVFLATLTHSTPNGGKHYIYALPMDLDIQSGTDLLGPGIDIKSRGGYIIIPPSKGVNGIPYSVEVDGGPMECPDWIIEAISVKKGVTGSSHGRFKMPDSVRSGTRNETLFTLACSLAAKGLSQDAILAAVITENEKKVVPPLPTGECEAVVISAMRYARPELRIINQPVSTGGGFGGEHPRLSTNLEEDNFVIMYIRYAGLNKAPYPDYHHASAITLLSIAADRTCYLSTASRDIYPNIWSMMLGETSIAHKSDAIDYPLQHARVTTPDTELPGHWSAAGLFQELSFKPRGYIIKDECSSILNNINTNKEAGAARDLLMQIYDCQDRIVKTLTKKKGGEQNSWVIENPYVTMLWATTPDNFSKNTTVLDVTSGWLLRFLMYYPNYRKEPVPFSFKNGSKNTLAQTVFDRYKQIRGKLREKGRFEFVMSPSGEEFFQNWQVSRELQIQANERSAESKSFNRLMVMALKLSMLYTIGSVGFLDDRNEPGKPVEIPERFVAEATRQIDEYFMPMAKYVFEMVERDASTNIQDKIRAKLQEGPCDRSTLLRHTRIKSKEFNEHLDTMLMSGEVSEQITTKTGGRDGVIYHLSG